jgi:hypothetical protein
MTIQHSQLDRITGIMPVMRCLYVLLVVSARRVGVDGLVTRIGIWFVCWVEPRDAATRE